MVDLLGVYHLYVLMRDTRAFLRDANNATEWADAREVPFLRRVYKRIKKGGLWPLLAVWSSRVPFRGFAVWIYSIAPADALFRMFLGLLWSLGTVWVYLYPVLRFGCLTALSILA